MDEIQLTVIDVETGGLDPATDALLSVGLVSMASGRELYLEILPFEGAKITDQALAINGFTPFDCYATSRISEHEAAKQIVSFFENEPRTLAGENPTFDTSFLQNLFKRTDQQWVFGHRTFDTHTLAITAMLIQDGKYPLKNQKSDVNLDTILEYCDIGKRLGSHNALEDAKKEEAVIHELLFQLGLEDIEL